MTISGDGASKEICEVKWGHKGEAWSSRINVCLKRSIRELILSLSPSLPFIPHLDLRLLNLQNGEKISLCWENKFLLFKPTRLWYFVIKALTNKWSLSFQDTTGIHRGCFPKKSHKKQLSDVGLWKPCACCSYLVKVIMNINTS